MTERETHPRCAYCGVIAYLECDGLLPNGARCGKPVCRQHGSIVGTTARESRDLCQDCKAAGRPLTQPTYAC